MKSYAVNFIVFVQNVIPSLLRQSKVIAYLTALLKPLQTLQDAFVIWQTGIKYDVSITNQVIYLEKLLNDKFDNIQRRIYIEDATSFTVNETRMKSENAESSEFRMKGETASAMILRMKSETDTEADFIVKKPSSVTDVTLMNAYLKKYKAASMQYKIEDV